MGRRTFAIAVVALVLAGLEPAVAHAACPTFASSNQVMGHVQDTTLNELSDLVASTDHPGVFWTEEDSSNPNNVYAINSSGEIVGVFTIQGTKDYDWEDLSIDRQAGTDFLYVGDIGDNKGTRNGGTGAKSFPRLYRFPEPTVSASGPKVTGTITAFDTFVYRYADANGTFIAPRNAESLMTDPITHDVYIVGEEGADDRRPEAELGLPLRPAASERRDEHRAQGRDHHDGEVLCVRRHLTVGRHRPQGGHDRLHLAAHGRHRGGDVQRPSGRTLHGLAAHRVGGHRVGAGRPVDGA